MKPSDDTYFNADFTSLMLEKKLGNGSARNVFEMFLLPNHVTKVEARGGTQNFIEHLVWKAVKDTEFAKWFCPVEALSMDSTTLIMKKTTPAPHDKYPLKVPAFFCDLKYQNWGMYEGRLVCHDYGVNILMERGMTKQMKKADWWDENDRT